jgi:5-methylcytosine-specific restriction protein B
MNPSVDAVLGAIPKWQQRCLIDGLGLFVDEPVWTSAAFDDLKKHYIDAPDAGTGNFFSKLGTQLEGASPAAQWLAVDIAWLMYLFPHGSIGAAKKVENLNQIASLGGRSLPPDHWALAPQVLQGVGGTGAFFVVSFWLEYSYAMLVLEALVHLPKDQRAALLQADADLMGWLDGLTLPAELPAGVQLSPQTRMFRHIWLFLMQPDRFERIGSTSQKRAIVKRMAPKVGLMADLSSPRRVDELLLQIRRTKEAELGTTELDFYQAPLHGPKVPCRLRHSCRPPPC